MRHITKEQLKYEIDSRANITIVEALPEKYWKEAHIPGSVQIDYTEVEEKAEKLLPDKHSKIVVYCANIPCQNSGKASRILESLGYTDVYEYAEGKEQWIDAGYPVVSEK